MNHIGFLHDIAANPDDDTPRLIFSDYLADSEDLRSEFIRVQIGHVQTLEELKLCPKNCPNRRNICDECRVLLTRYTQENKIIGELLNIHRLQWIGEWVHRVFTDPRSAQYSHNSLQVWDGSGGFRINIRFVNGFAGVLTCPMRFWYAHGPTVCLHDPIRKVEITDRFSGSATYLGKTYATWVNQGQSTDPGFVPGGIFEACFAIGAHENSCSAPGLLYRSKDVANNVLNTACLSWARATARAKSTTRQTV